MMKVAIVILLGGTGLGLVVQNIHLLRLESEVPPVGSHFSVVARFLFGLHS